MPTTETLIAFAVVCAGLMVVPGPSTLFILAHGIGHGRRAAMAGVMGIETASALRVVLTAAGLSAVLASSAVAFAVVRWAGVAYLVYLGVDALRARAGAEEAGAVPAVPAWRSYRRGLLVGLGNPKMAIFFVAFFPQFIDPAQGSVVAQTLVLGAVFWLIGLAWDLGCACASGAIGGWLRDRPRARALQRRFEAAVYFGLAGWAAVAGGRSRR